MNLVDHACAAYESAYYFGEAVDLLVKFGRYDKAIDVVTRYKQLVDVSLLGSIVLLSIVLCVTNTCGQCSSCSLNFNKLIR